MGREFLWVSPTVSLPLLLPILSFTNLSFSLYFIYFFSDLYNFFSWHNFGLCLFYIQLAYSLLHFFFFFWFAVRENTRFTLTADLKYLATKSLYLCNQILTFCRMSCVCDLYDGSLITRLQLKGFWRKITEGKYYFHYLNHQHDMTWFWPWPSGWGSTL